MTPPVRPLRRGSDYVTRKEVLTVVVNAVSRAVQEEVARVERERESTATKLWRWLRHKAAR